MADSLHWRLVVAAVYPKTCKLSESERNALDQILGDDESPCEGCAWTNTCDGQQDQKKVEEALFDDPERRCMICGNPTGYLRQSKLSPGSFRYCGSCDDEFVFEPSPILADTSSPEAVDF
jgi:ribosomal protein S14